MAVLKTIRSKLLLPAVALVAAVAGGVGGVAALEAGREAEARVRAEIGRAARSVVEGGFLRSPEVLRHVARFLGAEVATVARDGAIVLATGARTAPAGGGGGAFTLGREAGVDAAAVRALRDLIRENGLEGRALAEPVLLEGRLEGRRAVTVALADAAGAAAAVPAGDRLVLVYEGHILSDARWEALRPGLVVGAVGLVVAAAAAALLARSFVRPIERLSAAARRIERGDLGARLEVGTGDEVEALSRSLEAMVSGLRAAETRAHEAERLASLGGLLAALAHEVKNPLAALRVTGELVAERVRGPGEREAVSLLLEEIERLSLFSTKLLTHARGPVVAPRPASLGGIAHEVARFLGRGLDHIGVRIEVVDGAAEAPAALVDAVAFRHVVMNLVLNASEAMPGGGTVRLSVGSDAAAPDELCLAVEDEGTGVAPADVPRLFEPFFTRKPGGTGLGLAVSRAIVEAHGGTISYAPGPLAGSIFAVRVPAAAAAGALAPCVTGGGGRPWRVS